MVADIYTYMYIIYIYIYIRHRALARERVLSYSFFNLPPFVHFSLFHNQNPFFLFFKEKQSISYLHLSSFKGPQAISLYYSRGPPTPFSTPKIDWKKQFLTNRFFVGLCVPRTSKMSAKSDFFKPRAINFQVS